MSDQAPSSPPRHRDEDRNVPSGVRVAVLVMLLFGGFCIGGGLYIHANFPQPQGPRLEADPGAVGLQVSGFSYAWMLGAEEGVILVDTGPDDKAEVLRAELKSRELGPEDVKAILLTHGHGDHVGALQHFPDATIYHGPGEEALICKQLKEDCPKEMTELAHEQTLTIGGRAIQALHLPGHTRGSLGFIVDGKLLFIGDSLLASSDGGVGLAPSIFNEDEEATRESLQRLKKHRFETMADGHIGLTHGARAKIEAFLQE